MDIIIRINCDNAAFEGDNCGNEVERILRRLADRAAQCPDGHALEQRLADINGNTVGSVEVTP